MTQAHQLLYDEIVRLPIEKIGKAISFIRYLDQEPEPELVLEQAEETELHELLSSGGTVDASDVLAKIRELPDD